MTGPEQPTAGRTPGTGNFGSAAEESGSSRSPAVDEALAALANVADAEPAAQVAPLAEADRVLRDMLDSIGDV